MFVHCACSTFLCYKSTPGSPFSLRVAKLAHSQVFSQHSATIVRTLDDIKPLICFIASNLKYRIKNREINSTVIHFTKKSFGAKCAHSAQFPLTLRVSFFMYYHSPICLSVCLHDCFSYSLFTYFCFSLYMCLYMCKLKKKTLSHST